MKKERKEMSKQEKAAALRAEGKTIEEIADATGLSIQAVVDIIAKEGNALVTIRGAAEEALLKKKGATRLQMVERLSCLRDSLMAEIQSRGLKEIPTDKLLSIYLKVEEQLGNSTRKPEIISSFEMEQCNDL